MRWNVVCRKHYRSVYGFRAGGYLIIQPTEALTVIDVNTGKFEGGKKKEAAIS